VAANQTVLPELDLARIRHYCEGRVPARVSDKIGIEVDVSGRTVTILECRPPWRPDFGPEWTRFPIARLRYVQAHSHWLLYWRDSNLGWHLYERIDPSPHIDPLLAEIESDPTCIFWG
jgi:hypothetical protein